MYVFGMYDTDKKNYQDYAAWFDSSIRDKLVFPNWRMLQEYGGSVRRTNELNLRERMFCYLYLVRWMVRNRRSLMQDITIGLSYLWKKRFKA
jgi:hypothetical protein